MKYVVVAVALIACYLTVLTVAQVTTPPPVAATTLPAGGNSSCGGKGGGKNRNGRAATATPLPSPNAMLEKKFQEFAEQLGKTPEELKAGIGKFLQSNGISLDDIQRSIKEGGALAHQMVESVRGAMSGKQ